MNMTCAEWEEKLNAEMDGELAAIDRAALEVHLASCADCRRTREALRAQARDLESAFEPVRAETDALAAKIIAAVHAEPAPRRRSFRLVALAAAAAAGFLAAALIFRTPAPKPPEAFLMAATGGVEVQRGGAWQSIAPFAGVAAGDQIRTAPGSKCEIRTPDGSLIRLNESTEIQFPDLHSVHLKEGQVFALVVPQKTPFRFSTDQATLQCPEGMLDLTHEEQREIKSKFSPPSHVTSLAVLEGRAVMADQKSEQVVQPETACNVVEKTAESPVGIDPLLRSRWIHDLLKSKRRGDPEVGRRVTALLARLGRTKTPELFTQEIRSLGDLSVPPLMSIVTALPPGLSAYDRREAAALLADLAGPPEVPALVPLTSDADSDVAEAASQALSRITGQRLKGGQAWAAWYRENGSVWSCYSNPSDPRHKR
jgi:ferric-dicitrate binding protein FerR (iron transport regulator)